jgi:hypothetical protein
LRSRSNVSDNRKTITVSTTALHTQIYITFIRKFPRYYGMNVRENQRDTNLRTIHPRVFGEVCVAQRLVFCCVFLLVLCLVSYAQCWVCLWIVRFSLAFILGVVAISVRLLGSPSSFWRSPSCWTFRIFLIVFFSWSYYLGYEHKTHCSFLINTACLEEKQQLSNCIYLRTHVMYIWVWRAVVDTVIVFRLSETFDLDLKGWLIA